MPRKLSLRGALNQQLRVGCISNLVCVNEPLDRKLPKRRVGEWETFASPVSLWPAYFVTPGNFVTVTLAKIKMHPKPVKECLRSRYKVLMSLPFVRHLTKQLTHNWTMGQVNWTNLQLG